MEIIAKRGSVTVTGEDGESVRFYESNRGEPYRSGVEISIERGHEYLARVFLETSEVTPVRDLLNRLAPRGRESSYRPARLYGG
jgi:hypothetical protein